MLTGQAELPAHPPCVQRSPGSRQPGGELCTALFLQHWGHPCSAAMHSCLLGPDWIYLLFVSYCQTYTVQIWMKTMPEHTRGAVQVGRGGEEDDSMSSHQCHTWVIQEQLHMQQVQRTEMGHVQVFEDHTCLLSSGIVSHSGQQDTCQPAFYPAKSAHLLQTPLCDWFPEISSAVLQGPRQR